jgi:aspartyl/asparaginyl beta-hydroxylase (cupin superfamily)
LIISLATAASPKRFNTNAVIPSSGEIAYQFALVMSTNILVAFSKFPKADKLLNRNFGYRI